MAKQNKPKRKFTDPSHYYKQNGDRCSHIKIQFTVNTFHLIGTIYQMLNYDGTENVTSKDDKLTVKNVERKLKNILYYEGTDFFEKLGYEDQRDASRWEKAKEFAKQLFPKWFINYNNNTLRFITEGT